METVIYPGSFDPVTYGHIDIIKRAAAIFDDLTVCILTNKAKKSLFTVEERMSMLEEVVKDLGNVRITSHEGLLVDCAKDMNAQVIVRGLRAVTDFEYELQMAQTNRIISDANIDTMFLNTDLKYAYLSSSTVKEVASFGGDISKFVPDFVAELTYAKYK
ncbi:MAG: pantetheine-phosphate adenylyltransferase [Lachnospiraceae bacterium]|nr:pantetheine-phosphate adenylyltransferase [Lachnospiraceae bacterium]